MVVWLIPEALLQDVLGLYEALFLSPEARAAATFCPEELFVVSGTLRCSEDLKG